MTPARRGSPDPDAITAAVLACSTVAGLSGGVAGEVATYLPGRRVTGLRIDDLTVTVHVIGRYGPSMAEIGDQVGSAVAPLAGGRAVDVVIEDLETAGAGDADGPPDPPPAPVREPLTAAW